MLFVIGNAKFSNKNKKRSLDRIKKWNEVVTPGDLVIHIGNFAENNQEYYQDMLNGMIVFVVGHEHTRSTSGTKFKSLFIYDDLTFSQRKQKKKTALCILSPRAKDLTDTDMPEIVGEAPSKWTHKRFGERIMGGDYAYLLDKSVINADCALWNHAPIPITTLLQGLING
jgi:calcineurin-like phosphoesterase family protein